MANDLSRAPNDSKRHDGLWLCLGFVPKPSVGFTITDCGVVETGSGLARIHAYPWCCR